MEQHIVIEKGLLLKELENFAITCCLETAMLPESDQINKEFLRRLGKDFAAAYLAHLIELQADA